MKLPRDQILSIMTAAILMVNKGDRKSLYITLSAMYIIEGQLWNGDLCAFKTLLSRCCKPKLYYAVKKNAKLRNLSGDRKHMKKITQMKHIFQRNHMMLISESPQKKRLIIHSWIKWNNVPLVEEVKSTRGCLTPFSEGLGSRHPSFE